MATRALRKPKFLGCGSEDGAVAAEKLKRLWQCFVWTRGVLTAIALRAYVSTVGHILTAKRQQNSRPHEHRVHLNLTLHSPDQMSLKNLESNGLYVILFARNDPPAPNDFHWGLYLHRNSSIGGTKYHIKGDPGNWITDHGETRGVFKSFLLIGLCQIARIPAKVAGNIDQLLRTYDNQLNQIPGLSCRTWIFHVLELMRQPVQGETPLKCHDLQALENELKDFGNKNAQAACRNVQPRPVVRSALCGL